RYFFLLRLPRPPRPTLFPYTTLFRSIAAGAGLLLAGCTESRTPTQPTARAPSFLDIKDQQGPRTHIMKPRGQSNPHKGGGGNSGDRKSTRLNSSHRTISYAVFCLKKK